MHNKKHWVYEETETKDTNSEALTHLKNDEVVLSTYAQGDAGGKEHTGPRRRRIRCWVDPGLGRSPGGRHCNPLWYSCLENPMDRGDWRATVHGVAESDTLKQVSATQIYMLNDQDIYKLSINEALYLEEN